VAAYAEDRKVAEQSVACETRTPVRNGETRRNFCEDKENLCSPKENLHHKSKKGGDLELAHASKGSIREGKAGHGGPGVL